MVFSSTKIEFFHKPKVYQVPIQQAFKFPENEERTIVKTGELKLEDNQVYVEIMTQTTLTDPTQALELCERNIDNAITLIAALYGPYFLDSLVYRGWLIKGGWGILYSWVQPANRYKISIDGKTLFNSLSIARAKIDRDNDISNRFSLMSRFFVKSLSYSMGEEKFLLLWTILEIFPMKSTSNIRPVSEYLSMLLNIDARTVGERLEIGKLYGLRSALVHEGRFRVDMEVVEGYYDKDSELGHYRYKSEVLGKLECIVHEILRHMCGLPYSGLLDEHIK